EVAAGGWGAAVGETRSAAASVTTYPASTTICRTQNHSSTAQAPPTAVSPPNGAPSCSGKDRNSTNPCRKPATNAATRTPPATAGPQASSLAATTRKTQTSGPASSSQSVVKAIP